MIDRAECYRVLQSFSQLTGYPRKPEAVNAMMDAMQKFPALPWLKAWAGDILRNEHQCPRPADVYAAVRGEQAKTHKNTPTKCFECYDTGRTRWYFLKTWQRGERPRVERLTGEQAESLLAKHRAEPHLGLGNQEIYSAAVKCTCQKGLA